MKPVFRANIFALLVIVGQVFGGIIIVPMLRNMNLSTPVLLVLTQLIFLIIPTIIYFIVTKKSVKDTLKLNPISFKEVLILIVITLLSQPVAGFLGNLSNIFFKDVVGQVFNTLETLSVFSMLFIMAIVPAICEETVMRGVILSGYEKKSIFKAALMNGFIFGILHLNPQQFLYAFALGFLFVYIVRITNSIFSTMLCHFVFNGLQVVLSRTIINMPEVEKARKSLETLSTVEMLKELIPLAIVAIIATIIIVLLLKVLSNMRRNRGEITEGYSNRHLGDEAISVEDGSMSFKNSSMIIKDSFHEKELSREFVINIPFIITVLFYIFYVYKVYL